MTLLSGKTFYYCFLAGVKKIFEEQSYLNKINIFPVPDADTGTNMASTMRAIVDNAVPFTNIKDSAMGISDAALVGARGNSGIIFAQFLYGFATETPNVENLTTASFAQNMRKGFEAAYQSIANPVEGTIITVLRMWTETLIKLSETIDDFRELFRKAYEVAKVALAATSKMIKKNAIANIVDSGAQAFVFFLEGILSFLEDDSLKPLAYTRTQGLQKAENFEIDHEEITFRYCTECLLVGKNLDRTIIREAIETMGDSLVIAGGKNKMRIHIHTDIPSEIYRKIDNLGEIVYQKVDDMVFQQEVAQHRKHSIAIMTDSCCDLPDEYIEQHQIHMIPLNIQMNNSLFLDRLTINSDQFYTYLRNANKKEIPTTSQPSKKDFINKYNFLDGKYEEVINISVSGGLSGTYSNALTAAKMVNKEHRIPIHVVDSKNASGGEGLLVTLAAEAIENGASTTEVLEKMKEWIDHTETLVATKTLKFFISGGRVSRPKGFIANLFNLRPIVHPDKEGKGATLGSYFGRKGCLKHIFKLFEKDFKINGINRYAVMYTDTKEKATAEECARMLESISGQKPKFISQLSPVLGRQAGNGAIVVSYVKN